MGEPKRWEVWYADFPYDDDPGRSSDRPVIVLNTKPLVILSVKVTSHSIRVYDKYDTELKYWMAAGLTRPSVARISKVIYISKDRFRRKVGMLRPEDAKNILNTYDRFIQELESIAKDAARENADEETSDMGSNVEESTNIDSTDEESINEEVANEKSIAEESESKVSNDELKSSFFTDKEKEESNET